MKNLKDHALRGYVEPASYKFQRGNLIKNLLWATLGYWQRNRKPQEI